jgi:F-type H+-transporting ATPase subunit a
MDILEFLGLKDLHIELAAEELFHVGPLSVTNTIFTAWLVILGLVAFSLIATRRMELVPKGGQNVAEAIVETLFTLVEAVAGKRARSIFPFIATFFIYILVANWSGLLPGFNSIGFWHTVTKEGHEEHVLVPLLRAPNSDLNMTLAMALTAFVLIHVSGLIVHRPLGYLKHLAGPLPILIFINVAIEAFVPVSLSVRLFGNIFAGEVLLTVMSLPLVGAIFMILEVLFGLIQALIFTMLTLIFASLAMSGEHGHEAHQEAHAS